MTVVTPAEIARIRALCDDGQQHAIGKELVRSILDALELASRDVESQKRRIDAIEIVAEAMLYTLKATVFHVAGSDLSRAQQREFSSLLVDTVKDFASGKSIDPAQAQAVASIKALCRVVDDVKYASTTGGA